jgi:hypothetical protein
LSNQSTTATLALASSVKLTMTTLATMGWVAIRYDTTAKTAAASPPRRTQFESAVVCEVEYPNVWSSLRSIAKTPATKATKARAFAVAIIASGADGLADAATDSIPMERATRVSAWCKEEL